MMNINIKIQNKNKKLKMKFNNHNLYNKKKIFNLSKHRDDYYYKKKMELIDHVKQTCISKFIIFY